MGQLDEGGRRRREGPKHLKAGLLECILKGEADSRLVLNDHTRWSATHTSRPGGLSIAALTADYARSRGGGNHTYVDAKASPAVLFFRFGQRMCDPAGAELPTGR